MTAYEFIINLRNQASDQLRRIASEVGVVSNRVRQANKDLNNTNSIAKTLGNTFSGLKGKIIGIFAGIGLVGFTHQVIDARAEYEKFDAVLTNTFQNKDVGQGALAMLTDFAAKTPYQLNELTGGFIKLVNRGVYPTYEELTKLGDLASSQGKSFDQLVEGILDAQSGEFERMKEFGIKASKDGDKVTLSFKGITKEVANNETAIRDAILAYGGMKGVAGSMESVSKTLGGRISNMEDQWWGLLVAIGGYGGGIIGDTLGLLGDGLAFVQAHLPEIAHWFDILKIYVDAVFNSFVEMVGAIFGINDAQSAMQAFGDTAIWALVAVSILSDSVSWFFNMVKENKEVIYGITAALITYTVITEALALRVAFLTWYTGLSTAAIILNTLVTEGWTAAQMALNIAMSANPVGIIIILIAALVGIIVYAWNRFGWFRGAILGTWEVLKGFGEMIKNYVINRFTEMIKGLQGVGQMLIAFFNGDWKKAWQIGKDSVGHIVGKDSAEQALKDGKKAFGSFNKGWEEGHKENKNDSKDGLFSGRFNEIKNSFGGLSAPKGGNASSYTDYLSKLKNGPKPPGADKDKDKDKKKKKDGISSGGSKQTTFNISIQNMGTDTKIYVSSAEQIPAQLTEKIREEFLRMLNSSNQMQSSS
ncbi:MAG: hypothetical protein JNN23_04840 [Chryseobacterium gambrini]|nr:hypothetical protein [Chryseobacterium gambrini]